MKATEIDFVEDIQDDEWWNEVSDTEKEAIKLGLKDIEEGRIISNEDFVKSYGR